MCVALAYVRVHSACVNVMPTILRALAEEREDKTVILVSHRQSTMRITDKVYSVENGRMS